MVRADVNVLSTFGLKPPRCTKRMPKVPEGPIPVVSVVVDEAVVHGVIGGGDNGVTGVAGVNGHRIRELGSSIAWGVNIDSRDKFFWKSTDLADARLRDEPARTSCLKAATGDEAAKPKRLAEPGVTGVERPGEPRGGWMSGSW